MTWFGVTIVNHYEALGIDRSASMDDIKKAYRRLVREHHPDVSSAQTEDQKQADAARFDEVQQAYDWLVAHHQPEDTQEPIYEEYFDEHPRHSTDRVVEIIIDGQVPATLRYTTHIFGYPVVHMNIQLDDARKLKGFPEGERIRLVNVMEGKELLFSVEVWSFEVFQEDLRQYGRRQEGKVFEEQLNTFRTTAIRYENEGRPVDRLWQFIDKATRMVAEFQSSWRRRINVHDVKSALKAVENEAAKLQSGGIELLVDGLINGSIFHPDIDHNNQVVMALDELSIRSAGFIEPITEEALRQFYQRRIGKMTDFREIRYVSLRLTLEDYAPADLLKDPELELAPEKVEIQNGNRSSAYEVHYEVIEIEGVSTQVGIITIPCSLYQRNRAEYGKASKFPSLPHGIRLMLEVEKQGKRLAIGFDDDKLAGKVDKALKAAARGKKLEGTTAKDGYGIYGLYERTTVPPWYKGQRIR